jgi:DNA-directed RNA polymerase beta' subunit
VKVPTHGEIAIWRAAYGAAFVQWSREDVTLAAVEAAEQGHPRAENARREDRHVLGVRAVSEADIAAMSDADLQRQLDHLRGIRAFWDEADRLSVQTTIAMLERAVASRNKP